MEKKKMVTVEVITKLNNNDLKNLYKHAPKDCTEENVKVVQVQVSLMQPAKAEKK